MVARDLWSRPRSDWCPVSSTDLCAQVNISLGCSDCQVGSCATAEMDRVKTPMLLALGDGVLILNAKEILVHEKEHSGVSEDAELVTAGFSTV